MELDMYDFDLEAAARAWNRLSEKYSHRYKKVFSAWDRLSHYLRHHFSRTYDGGMLRVIAFFGESFPEYLSDTTVSFSAGPMTGSISSDPHSDAPSERYLLLRMADCFATDEHLNRYIKDYTNAWHQSPREETRRTQFRELLDLLRSEMASAERRGDINELTRLQTMARMIQVISRSDIA